MAPLEIQKARNRKTPEIGASPKRKPPEIRAPEAYRASPAKASKTLAGLGRESFPEIQPRIGVRGGASGCHSPQSAGSKPSLISFSLSYFNVAEPRAHDQAS